MMMNIDQRWRVRCLSIHLDDKTRHLSERNPIHPFGSYVCNVS